jgi:hypothetical protein
LLAHPRSRTTAPVVLFSGLEELKGYVADHVLLQHIFTVSAKKALDEGV